MQRIRDVYEQLSAIIEDLKSLPTDALILVEGRKDEISLRKLGITAKIVRAHSPRPLPESLSGFREVIILTDYDREGRLIAHKLESTVRSFGVSPNLEFRKRLRRATFGEISHVEGLHTYFKSINRKALRPR